MCSANEQMSVFRILQETLSPSKRDNIISLRLTLFSIKGEAPYSTNTFTTAI